MADHSHSSISGVSQSGIKPRTVDAVFYAQVKPKFGRRYDSSQGKSVDSVDHLTVVTITQKRPTKPQSGCVVVKLTLRFNERAFLPLAPQAVIEIPDVLTDAAHTILVEADDPTDGGSAAAVDYLAQVARGLP